MLEMKMTGADSLLKMLSKLPVSVQNEVALESLTRSILPVVAAVREEAPSNDGALKQSIGFRLRRYKGGKHLFAIVGPRRGTFGSGAEKPSKYANQVEFGHAVRGDSGVQTKPNAFMRRGWERTKQACLRAFHSDFSMRLKKVIAARAVKRRKTK